MTFYQHRLGIGMLGPSGQYSTTGTISEIAIRKLIEAKFDYIDTASVYGPQKHAANIKLGDAISLLQCHPNIVNKVGADLMEDESSEATEILNEDHNRSFSDLRIDRLDAVLLHRPRIELIERDIPFLKRLRKDPRVSAIGICTNSLQVYQCYQKAVGIDILQIAVNLLDYRANRDILSIAKDDGTHVQARSVLSSGLLTGKYHEDSRFHDSIRVRYKQNGKNLSIFKERLKKVYEIENYFRKNSQTLGGKFRSFGYRAILCNPFINSIILGGSTADQITENINEIKLPIPNSKHHEILELSNSTWHAPYL